MVNLISEKHSIRKIRNGIEWYFVTKIVLTHCEKKIVLKALLRTNVLNDVTAAPFSVSFLQLAAEKKTPKTVQL